MQYVEIMRDQPYLLPFLLTMYLTLPTPGHHFADALWTLCGVHWEGSSPVYQFLVYVGVPFLLPTLLCIACMGVNVRCLLKRRAGTVHVLNPNKTNKHITVTILLLTSLFVVCNSFFIAVFYGSYIWTKESHPTHSADSYLLYFTVNIVPFLNSALTPVILIVRGRSLNRFVRGVFWRGTRVAVRDTPSETSPTAS